MNFYYAEDATVKDFLTVEDIVLWRCNNGK